ncbi:MAG: hypothetical protein ACI364_00395 [Coriobacteriales bacterium]
MIEPAPEFGDLQRLVDMLFQRSSRVSQIDLILSAEQHDLCEDLIEICRLVPAGTYTRRRLVDKMNASIVGHGWSQVYGLVD